MMAQRTVKLRRFLGATALCGGMAVAAAGLGAGVASADPRVRHRYRPVQWLRGRRLRRFRRLLRQSVFPSFPADLYWLGGR
jgi:hypothetical protein